MNLSEQCEDDQSCFHKQHATFWWVEAGWRHFPSTCNSRCDLKRYISDTSSMALLCFLISGIVAYSYLDQGWAGSTWDVQEKVGLKHSKISGYISEAYAPFTKSRSILRLCIDFCYYFLRFLFSSFIRCQLESDKFGGKIHGNSEVGCLFSTPLQIVTWQETKVTPGPLVTGVFSLGTGIPKGISWIALNRKLDEISTGF